MMMNRMKALEMMTDEDLEMLHGRNLGPDFDTAIRLEVLHRDSLKVSQVELIFDMFMEGEPHAATGMSRGSAYSTSKAADTHVVIDVWSDGLSLELHGPKETDVQCHVFKLKD